MIRMPYRCRYLSKLFNCIPDLFIENSSVSDDNDRVENRLAVFLQPDELMREPGNRVALSAAC